MSDEPQIIWRPSPGPQHNFLACSAYEALYGGAAGGGKTDALVVAPLRWCDQPTFNGIIFRRTFPELQGQVIPKSRQIYTPLGGKYNSVDHCWTFPSGARIHFGHLQHESDVYRYQGWEFQFIGFDELTQFTEKQYVYLLSRARSVAGIPIRIRSSSNPGGIGHEWVQKRWAPWLDRSVEYRGPRAEPAQVMYYDVKDSGEEWTKDAKQLSRVFIPAKAADNIHLMAGDPDYVKRLGGLDAVTRAQLRDGDWMVKPAAGFYFKREWLTWLDAKPVNVMARVRRWDLASTQDGGDWTVGTLMSRDERGHFVIEDVVRRRLRPEGVEAVVLATAQMDGHEVRIEIPQDPGQAGKAQCTTYAKLLLGYNVHFERETGDKVTRAKGYSAQWEARNFSMVRGAWNEPFIQCHEAFFTEGEHDDDVDSAAGAFNSLSINVASYGTADVTKGPGYTFGNELPSDEWEADR